MSSDQHHDSEETTNTTDGLSGAGEESEHRPVSLRDRIIPFSALGILVILIGVFAYTLYTPTSSSLGAGGRVNSTGSKVFLGDRMAPDFTLETFDG